MRELHAYILSNDLEMRYRISSPFQNFQRDPESFWTQKTHNEPLREYITKQTNADSRYALWSTHITIKASCPGDAGQTPNHLFFLLGDEHGQNTKEKFKKIIESWQGTYHYLPSCCHNRFYFFLCCQSKGFLEFLLSSCSVGRVFLRETICYFSCIFLDYPYLCHGLYLSILF